MRSLNLIGGKPSFMRLFLSQDDKLLLFSIKIEKAHMPHPILISTTLATGAVLYGAHHMRQKSISPVLSPESPTFEEIRLSPSSLHSTSFTEYFFIVFMLVHLKRENSRLSVAEDLLIQ